MFFVCHGIVIASVPTSLKDGFVTFETCLDIDLGNGILDITPKAKATSQKIDGNVAN